MAAAAAEAQLGVRAGAGRGRRRQRRDDQRGEDGADPAPLAVSADQLDEALDELLDTRNAMTRVLLGASGYDDEGN